MGSGRHRAPRRRSSTSTPGRTTSARTTIADFEAEYGIKVNYDTYDSTEVVEARLLAGRTGNDVVVHAERYSARLIPIGIYQPLDRSKLTLWDNLDPWVLKMLARTDPGNRYGVPYLWGTTGFAYNVRMIRERMPDAPVDSGDIIFKPAVARRFADCGITFLDEPTDVIPLAMLYLGHDPNSLAPGAISPRWRHCSKACVPTSAISARPRCSSTCRTRKSASP